MTEKTILMVAFHYPPFTGSSGVQRTLRFSQYLGQHQWRVLVLTANSIAYESTSDDLDSGIDASVIVKRAFALDTARHFAVFGKYLKPMALPDRWVSWILGAVPSGWLLSRKYKPSVIWSTYPIASAHLIGYFLHRLTGIAWIADFRDPMVEYVAEKDIWAPADTALRKLRLWIETRAVENATRCVFCTDGALEICRQRYPAAPHSKWAVIPNGFDESAFQRAETAASKPTPEPPRQRRIRLLHSGVLYPGDDRNPKPFMQAVRALLDAGEIGPERFTISLRASGHDKLYAEYINDLQLGEVITLDPPVPYDEALAEMLSCDGLLLFQGFTSNPAIPAKVYEYLRAHRPILALVDEAGDTAKLLGGLGVGIQVPLDKPNEIRVGMQTLLRTIEDGSAHLLTSQGVKEFSRQEQTRRLNELLRSVVETTDENIYPR